MKKPDFIMCPRCGAVSHQPDVIGENYCDNCDEWYDNMAADRRRAALPWMLLAVFVAVAFGLVLTRTG